MATVLNAAFKAIASIGRRAGMVQVADGWAVKAAACELCPLRFVQCGVSYCGKPYLWQIDRVPHLDGCGCPCREKAKAIGEHCPLDRFNREAVQTGGKCGCKWCTIGAS